MIRVVKMIVLQDTLIIFAENGIWGISGGDSGFKATEYQIRKLSDTGTAFPDSIVNAEGTIFFWSNTGIYSIGAGESGGLSVTNISLMTIQTLYNSWTQPAKENCIGIFEERNARIRWLLNTSSGYDGINYRQKYNYELVYDVALGAFYPLKLDISSSSAPYVAAHVFRPNYANSTQTNEVVVNGVQVQENTVNVQSTVIAVSPEAFDPFYLAVINTGGTFYFTFASYKDTTFVDWFSYNNIGLNYDCYLVTGYDVFKDAMRTKGVPYLYLYCYQTEESFLTSDTDLILTNQSSALVQAQWNWTNSSVGGKWGTQFQGYRLKRDFIPTQSGQELSNGETVVVTKNKLRGLGKSLSLYISSEAGKDLHLVGWAIFLAANQRPI